MRGHRRAAQRPGRRGLAPTRQVFLHVDWTFAAPVRPGDVITARAVVTAVRADKPVTLRTTVLVPAVEDVE